nr:hypothetical protein DVH24_025984 [Ipomoea batatas]
MLACVNGTSPFPGISRTVFLAFTFRCFSNIPTIMGTVTGEVLPRLKIRYGAGPRFFPPDPVLRPAVSSDATHPLTISSIARASPNNSGLGLGTLAGLEERDEGRDIAMNIRVGILHRISHPGLRRQVHHVRERHHIKKLRQQTRVVHVTLHHEDSLRADQFPPRFLQRRVVVVVEVVQPHHPVAPLFQGQGHVRPDESGGAGYQYRHPVVAPDLSGRAYDAVKAIKNSAQRNIVLVDAQHRWTSRFIVCLSLNFPGVDGKSSSSNDGIFQFFAKSNNLSPLKSTPEYAKPETKTLNFNDKPSKSNTGLFD